MPKVIAKQFNIKKADLADTWNGLPQQLKTSIVATLLWRAKDVRHDNSQQSAK